MSKKLCNHNIHIRTRVMILNSMVRSRLTYSCQTWNLTTRQTGRINSTYSAMLRKMVKGRYRCKKGEWNFVLSNNDIHNICKTEDISDFTERQQRNYLAHLVRQPNARLTKRLLFNSNDAIKPGRQSTLLSKVLLNEGSTLDEFCKRALNKEI